jgi:predicted 3-demethylubiquinone-9 3-methyltransferase (glyoxalase superfamily)
MQTIIPCLWFDAQAEAAANFYVSIFNNARIHEATRYDAAMAEVAGQPEGSVLTVEFEIEGYRLTGLNGGPAFKPTPALSFMVNCDTAEEVEGLWEKLSEGGKVLMPLDAYPFSKKYGWLEDAYGVSWQLILSDPAGDMRPKIIPAFLFVGEQGQSEAAATKYLSVFKDAKLGALHRYGAQGKPGQENDIMFMDFTLAGQWFAAMDGGVEHAFTFTEGVSLQVMCDTQAEIDSYWEALSAVPESEQCGWLKDEYGVSWQIVPKTLPALLKDSDTARAQRVGKAMLAMKKLDIAALEAAAAQTE